MDRLNKGRSRRSALLAWVAFCTSLCGCGARSERPAVIVHEAVARSAPRVPSSNPGARPSAGTDALEQTLVAHGELASRPGFESRLYLAELPPGAEAAVHESTEQCVGYVLEGSFASAFGLDAPTVKQAGEAFLDLAGQPHRLKNLDAEHPVRFLLAGTFRIDEPLFRGLPGVSGFAPKSVPAAPAPSLPQASSALTEVKRSLLISSDLATSPGIESRIYLIEFPPGAASKLHLHTTQGIGYVLEGSFESAFGDGAVTIKRAGQGFVDLPGQPHHFKNADPARPLRFVFAGTFHQGEQLFQLIPL